MTNLKLPPLTYDSLNELLAGRPFAKVGYQTEVERSGNRPGLLRIFHHGTNIADVSQREVWLNNPGWHSRTTAYRLNRVCVDNGLESRVGIRDGYTHLIVESRTGNREAYPLKHTTMLIIGTD